VITVLVHPSHPPAEVCSRSLDSFIRPPGSGPLQSDSNPVSGENRVRYSEDLPERGVPRPPRRRPRHRAQRAVAGAALPDLSGNREDRGGAGEGGMSHTPGNQTTEKAALDLVPRS